MTRFTKGHGTENDFILVADLEGTLELTPAQVQRLTDRHAGIGADGVIRVVRTRFATDETVQALAPEAEWFMDYRNADGSHAEMCGNGARVFAAFLRREGLVFGSSFSIATRAGVKTVRVTDEGYAVDLGPWALADEQAAQRDGFDVMVRPRLGKPVPAVSRRPRQPARRRHAPRGHRPRAPRPHRGSRVHPDAGRGPNVEFVRRRRPRSHRDAGARARRRRDPLLWHRCCRRRARDPLLVGRARTLRRGPSTCPADA